MAAVPAAIAWLAAGLGLSHVAPDMLTKDKKNGNNQNTNSSGQYPPAVYHIQGGNQGFGFQSMFMAGCIGAGVAMSFATYKYFFAPNPSQQILDEVAESGQQALEQVRKADENARARAQQMDENNTQRLLDLRAEMQGEQRGNFNVLTEQLNCLIQIGLQTLTTVTPGEQQLAITPGGVHDEQALAELNQQRKALLDYAQNAQNFADQINDKDYQEQKRKEAMKSIRATIPSLPALTQTPHGESLNNSLSGPHELSDGRKKKGRRKKADNSGGNGMLMSAVGATVGLFGGYFMKNS